MKSTKKSDLASIKRTSPQEALLGFLVLLNEISAASGLCEFCTPGHKAGRGFEAMLVADSTHLSVVFPEEVS